jgi:spore coat polysaccharide biosynthesis protein SpsF
MKKKVAAIIQARVGSTRLPKKAMLKIEGKPLLEYMISQVKKSSTIDEIIVATSKKSSNNIIRSFCKKNNINCYSGSENNLVERYCEAAKSFGVSTIVRLTSDCPLIDPQIIDKCVKKFINSKYDFVSNTSTLDSSSYPDGMDVEVFSYNTLKYVNRVCKNDTDLEHVTPFIWRKRTFFKIFKLKLKKDLSHYRLTIDYKEDLELTKKIIVFFKKKKITINLKNIINFLMKNKNIYLINKVRNKKFKLY